MPDSLQEAGSDTPFVEIRNVSMVYGKGDEALTALKEISLDLADSEFVSIVGPSGCGKSTLLTLVAGLLRPATGTIKIDGRQVSGPDDRLGMMFQSDLLLDWMTIRENVLLQADFRGIPRRDALPRANELLEVAHLAGFEDKRPWELSGGMRQRAAICRTLLHKPKLLLMDEPFGALDALTREKMGRFLEEIWETEKSAVLFVTHSIDEAVYLSDRVIVMSGRPGEMLDTIPVELDRPRVGAMKTSHEFTSAVATIMTYFEETI